MKKITLLILSILIFSNVCFADDLVEKFNLSNTNKIIIVTNAKIMKTEKMWEIEDKNVIVAVLSELKTTRIRPVVDTWTQYLIRFYHDNILLAELGYNKDDIFLRYKYWVHWDYIPSEKFRNIISNNIRSIPKEQNSKKDTSQSE